MTNIRASHRWAPWWLAAIVCVLYIPLLYAVIGGLRQPEQAEGLRIFLPPFGLFTYWVLAVLLNKQTASVTPTRVRLAVLPLPVGTGQSASRASIAYGYISHARVKKRGAVIEEFHTIGVATKDNNQIDLQSTFDSVGAATQAARQMLDVLNQSPSLAPLELYRAGTPPFNFLRPASLWLVYFVLAVLIGAAWETKIHTP